MCEPAKNFSAAWIAGPEVASVLVWFGAWECCCNNRLFVCLVLFCSQTQWEFILGFVNLFSLVKLASCWCCCCCLIFHSDLLNFLLARLLPDSFFLLSWSFSQYYLIYKCVYLRWSIATCFVTRRIQFGLTCVGHPNALSRSSELQRKLLLAFSAFALSVELNWLVGSKEWKQLVFGQQQH